MKRTVGLALVSCCVLAAACKKNEEAQPTPAPPATIETADPAPASSGDLEVRYQLTVDGATHEVTGAPIKLDGGAELSVRERPDRRYRGDRFSFDYPSRVRVGATAEAVTAASGSSMTKLVIVPRSEVEATSKNALDTLRQMTGGAIKDRTRTIAGKPVAGKSVVTTAANREKELYWIPLDDTDALHLELLHPLGADLADLLAVIASITPGTSEARADFDLLAGGKAIAELTLDTPAEVDIGGAAHQITIANRPMVRRRIGRVSFEHPPSASVAKQTNPLGSGVQIGLDNVAVTALVIAGSPSELRSAMMSQGAPAGPVKATIGGKPQSGTSLSMFGGAMIAELYTMGRGSETFVVMVQYPPVLESERAKAEPILASLEAR